MREDDRQDDGYGEHEDAQEQALTGFLRPDIDNLCLTGSHGKVLAAILLIDLNLRSALERMKGDRHIFWGQE
jgi:hypothetical protein